MKTIVAVPMKDLRLAKSRLAPMLDPVRRRHVALDLFNRGQRFLSHEFPELERLVITPCALVTSAALKAGALVWPDSLVEPADGQANERRDERGQAGLNRAAMAALERARVTGADWLLIIPGDLPYLLVREFQQLLSQRKSGCASVATSRDGGTNALLLPVAALPADWRFSYGRGSAARHAALLVQSGLRVAQLELPALAHDVDSVEDYARLTTWWEGGSAAICASSTHRVSEVIGATFGPAWASHYSTGTRNG